MAIAPGARFEPNLGFVVRQGRDAAFFPSLELAERFRARRAVHPDWVHLSGSLGGVGLVLVQSVVGGFTIWLNLSDGQFLVYRDGQFRPPPHVSLLDARGAVLEMLEVPPGP